MAPSRRPSPLQPTLQGKDPHGLFAEADMVACVLDMVMAGTETTSATLQWAALLMSRHPSVQGEPPASLSSTRRWAGSPRARGGGPGLAGTRAPTFSPAGRVQEELDRVLGPGRLPRLEDQRSLPYTSAVLHEVQRSITLLPHVPRCMAADTQLGGYLLPKVGPPPGPRQDVHGSPSPFCSRSGWAQLGLAGHAPGGRGRRAQPTCRPTHRAHP